MKKVKIFLATTVLLLTVGGAVAFKAHTRFGLGNTYVKDGEQCNLDDVCALTASGGTQCAGGTHYTTSECTTEVSNDQTVVE